MCMTINQFKSEHHFLKWMDNLPFFLAKYMQITIRDKKRFKSPKPFDVILKFTAVNIKFTTQQKICEQTFLRETK